jgi:GNAT superfamily N-acetyltransferase
VTPGAVSLRDGARIRIRPIEPADRDQLAAEFERLSPESRYRRFFGPVKELSARHLDHLTQVDHHDHEALVALDDATGRGVGVARYVRTRADEAEPAVVVADDWQGRGVGSRLLEQLSDRAREEGIARFRAPVLAQNRDAIALMHQLGRTDTAHLGREVEVTVELSAAEVARSHLCTLLREAAAGTVAPARTLLQRLRPPRAGHS